MKKEKVLLISLFLAGIAAGGAFVYWGTTVTPASDKSYEAVNSDLIYDGVYIDLIEQVKIDTDLEGRQNAPASDSSELYVVKYNSETGYVDGTTVTGAGVTDRQLSFEYEGVQLDLHFVNDVLIGCRRTYEQELTDRLAGQALEACTAEEREAAERGALEVILNNSSWETDEAYLKLVLTDYTEQVLEYQNDHPGAISSNK